LAVALDAPNTIDDATRACTVTLLGGFGLRDGGGVVELPTDAQRVVAFLALQHQRVPRAYVAGSLWLDGSQERAFGNLRSALWRLRRKADHLIDADHTTLAIDAGVTTDVDTLNSVAHHLCDPAASTGTTDVDPDLFTRDLLPGWYDEWALIERERLRQLSLHALEALAARLAERHHYAAAIQAALAAIRLDPLRESAHRAAIHVHLAEGNHSEALRQYHTYRDLLDTELGIAPSPRLEALLR
jgi:DNA-binding SARP family transcriptional activator